MNELGFNQFIFDLGPLTGFNELATALSCDNLISKDSVEGPKMSPAVNGVVVGSETILIGSKSLLFNTKSFTIKFFEEVQQFH